MRKILNLIVAILCLGLTNCSHYGMYVTNKSDDTVILHIEYKNPIIIGERKGRKILFNEQENGYRMEYIFNEIPKLDCSEDGTNDLFLGINNLGKMIVQGTIAEIEIYPHKKIFMDRIIAIGGEKTLKQYISKVSKIEIRQGIDTTRYVIEDDMMRIFSDFNNGITFNNKSN